jgi:hypothetical protein
MFLFNAISDRTAAKHIKLKQMACGIVHPITKETITKYNKLANDPITKYIWQKEMYKELGRLAQGFGKVTGTNTVLFMSKQDIRTIPCDRTVT